MNLPVKRFGARSHAWLAQCLTGRVYLLQNQAEWNKL
jgi:hypothetical protein